MSSVGEEEGEVRIEPSRAVLGQAFASLVAACGALLMGCSLGWSSPVLVLMNSTSSSDGFPLSKSEEGWLASILFFGAIAGGPLAGFLIDKLGRKVCLGLNAVNYALALALISSSVFKWMLFLGRFLNGVSCGFTSICVPTYISEVASPSNRGKFGIMFQVMVTAGILLINILGLLNNWRWITISIIIMDAVWIILLYFIPESPIYYLMKNDEPSARRVLSGLRVNDAVQGEIVSLRHAMESMSQSSSFSDLLKSYNLRPLFISILVMMGQQTSGINAVLSYSQNIFALTSSGMSPLMETIIMDLMMVVATLLAAGVSDRLGRRFLIIISGSTIFLSLLSIGTYYFLDSGGYPIVKSLSWLPLVSLCFHVMSFSFGYGPIPWLLMSEIFAPEIRGYASAIASGSNWGMGFLVTLSFPILTDLLGQYPVFFIYAGGMLILLLLAIIFVPETKGKTLEEIQRIFRPEGTTTTVTREPKEAQADNSAESEEDNVSERALLI
eukprot:TRINITY_DN2451_c0_g1_i4.p1 TRINITY_DN2451_c0_g1~~TRINITY_DN2451_c0_g1_i4.p1  ORF type:complete len:498 (+),score=103.43 TRINITY_DN2451_c0_g1_i4:473-1966(+)